jgi:hypothetical protein
LFSINSQANAILILASGMAFLVFLPVPAWIQGESAAFNGLSTAFQSDKVEHR